MCMSAPKMPEIKPPPPLPTPPKPRDDVVRRSGRNERRRALLNSQRNPTGPQGLTSTASTTRPTLLGGVR